MAFLLRSKSYGDTRSASKMPAKGFFDTLEQSQSEIRLALLFVWISDQTMLLR